jgi:hypothetical protein
MLLMQASIAAAAATTAAKGKGKDNPDKDGDAGKKKKRMWSTYPTQICNGRQVWTVVVCAVVFTSMCILHVTDRLGCFITLPKIVWDAEADVKVLTMHGFCAVCTQ